MSQEFKTIYTVIKALQATAGDNDKQDILFAAKDLPYFKEYMKAVYDTVNINYYQKKLPDHGLPSGRQERFDMLDVQHVISTFAERRLTGKAAIAAMKKWVEDQATEEDQELCKYIIDRSIGANVGDTMVLNTWPGLYFIPPYMRCKSMTKKLKEKYAKLDSFYVQTKRDGSFAYLQRGPVTRALTRQGSSYPAWFVERATEGMNNNVVLMGEFEVDYLHSPMPRADANGVLNSVLKGADESEFEDYYFRYVAWDCVTASEFTAGRCDKHYEDRLQDTIYTVSFMLSATFVASPEAKSIAEANAIHIDHTRRGLEGTVWKTKQGGWKNSSGGTDDMVKNKVVFECEYEVLGYKEGEGKDAGSLGAVTLGTKCRAMVFDCGSGFSAKQRADYWAIKEQLPGKIFSAEGNDITTSRSKDTFSLSLPIFTKERFDKTEADTYTRVLEQFEAAKEGREKV